MQMSDHWLSVLTLLTLLPAALAPTPTPAILQGTQSSGTGPLPLATEAPDPHHASNPQADPELRPDTTQTHHRPVS